MSFRIINGRQIELLDETDFFTPRFDPWFRPKPVITKCNNILFADNSGNIHIQRSFEKKTKPVIKRKFITTGLTSVLGKRKIADAFGPGIHDKERYGQEIDTDFFKTNIGHGVYQNPKGSQDHRTQGTAFAAYTPSRQASQIHSSSKNISPNQEAEIIDWCYKYLASKKA